MSSKYSLFLRIISYYVDIDGVSLGTKFFSYLKTGFNSCFVNDLLNVWSSTFIILLLPNSLLARDFINISGFSIEVWYFSEFSLLFFFRVVALKGSSRKWASSFIYIPISLKLLYCM